MSEYNSPGISERHKDIEEGFIKKPRQTVVVAFWGKLATQMPLLSLCSRQTVTRQAGSKLRGGGGICILNFF